VKMCKKCNIKMDYHSEYVDDNKGNEGMCRYWLCPKCNKHIFEERDEFYD